MMVPERTNQLPVAKKFNKGEPLALGITQILLGILTILFAVVGNVGYIDSSVHRKYFYIVADVFLVTPYWTGGLYIISGSLTVTAAKNSKPSWVKGMLAMNVISTLVAGIFIIYAAAVPDYRQYRDCFSSTTEYQMECYEFSIIPERISQGIMIILLLFSVLEFCITISNAAFGCKAVCKETFPERIVVVYRNPPPDYAVGPPADVKDVWTP